MGRLKLAVAGGSSYAGRLADYIRRHGPVYLEVYECRDNGQLTKFLAGIQPDILLCEKEEAMREKTADDTVKILLVNTEGEKAVTGPVIFRYQHGAEILRQIFWIYGQESKKDMACWYKTDEIQMDAIYAPGGHELQFPFSVTYASLCGQECKTLYLNMSEFSGMVPLLGDPEGECFSDLVYGIRQKKEKFQLFLQSVLHHTEKFDYVHPPVNPKDLYEIQEEDLLWLLTLLTEQTEYKCVVWNIGTWNQLSEQILKHCRKVFCIVKQNSFGKYRKTEFERFLKKEEGKGLKQKVCYVSPQNGNGGVALQGADLLTQLQNSEFAEQVRRLTQDV